MKKVYRRGVYIIGVLGEKSLPTLGQIIRWHGSKDVGILSVSFEQLEVLFNGPVFRCDGMRC